MKRALLLIDVQDWYIDKEHSGCLKYIHSLIDDYSSKRRHVFNMIFEDMFGISMERSVKKKLDKLSFVWHISKSGTNGAKEMKDILALKGFNKDNVKIDVCGFYTDQCVFQTVLGLKKAGYKIVVHYAGVGSSEALFQNSSINRMKKAGVEIKYEDNNIDRKKHNKLRRV